GSSSTGSSLPLVKGNIYNPIYITSGKMYAGTYRAFDLKISPVSDSTVIIPNFKNYKTTRIKGGPYSMLIKGTYNSSTFIFTTKKDLDIRLKFHTPMHFSQYGADFGIAITTNIRKWFRDGNGLLDPSDP